MVIFEVYAYLQRSQEVVKKEPIDHIIIDPAFRTIMN